MKQKFAIRILRHKAEDGLVFRAAASVEALRAADPALRKQLGLIELDYSGTVAAARTYARATSLSAGCDARAYWLIGNAVYDFLKRLGALGFYLAKQNETLARDLGISESSLGKILGFHRRFPDIALVDSTIPWEKYRSNKVPLPASGSRRKSAQEEELLF